MSNHLARLGACAGLLAGLAAPCAALAHGIAGKRFFPATLTVEDPAVADELALPTVSSLKDEEGWETEIEGEYAKRITRGFGLSIGQAWSHVSPPGELGASGFSNLETAAKWQALTSDAHEAIVSLGVEAEWANSGTNGFAEAHTTLTPTLWFGKGFGDLPERVSWARPFAVTGVVGYALPTRAKDTIEIVDEETGLPSLEVERNPRVLHWGGSLQYSLPYLRAQVRDLGWPEWANHLTPLVEASFETAVGADGGQTTGTINPGVIWAGRRFQVGAEALIPINGESGEGVGFVAQLHFYLDDLFPHSLGAPIW